MNVIFDDPPDSRRKISIPTELDFDRTDFEEECSFITIVYCKAEFYSKSLLITLYDNVIYTSNINIIIFCGPNRDMRFVTDGPVCTASKSVDE